MNRRQFMQAGLVTMIGATSAGSVKSGNTGYLTRNRISRGQTFPSYELPGYSDWIPDERHTNTEAGLFFTHVDWDAMNQLESDGDSESDGESVGEITEQVPIVGLPLYSAIITPLALFGILFYPFSDTVLPDNGEAAEGIDTTDATWTDNLLVFQGSYSPDVFAEEYADGFEADAERDGFTVYVGADEFTEGMAYAVSEETLIAGMHPGEEEDYVPEEIVRGALDRTFDGNGRMVDTDDGQWLFETTGEAQAVFGGWKMEDLLGALEPEDETDQETVEPETEPDVEANPIYDNVDSVVNNLVFTVEDGEMQELEARFSGLYPDGAVPSESEVRDYLIGTPEVPHDIIIDGTRVHATATFEERPRV